MPATQATTMAQRREMMRLVQEGHTYAEAAEQIGVSFWTARKWIRLGKRYGKENMASCFGRPESGSLANCDPVVPSIVLRLKRQHPKWGAEYVHKKLGENPALQGQSLPGATTIWRYWRSLGDRLFPKRDPSKSVISPSDKPHGVWQMDAKESMPIPGVGFVSINQDRDDYGRVTVMHRVPAEPERARQLARWTSETALQDCFYPMGDPRRYSN